MAKLSTENGEELRRLEPPNMQLDKICAAFREEASKRLQKSISEGQEEDLRRKEEEKGARERKEEIQKTQDWLNNLSPRRNHRHSTLTAARQPGTGEWFVDLVSKMIDLEGKKVVWTEGKPGVGKSMLMSAVIDHFNTLLKNIDGAEASQVSGKTVALTISHTMAFEAIAYTYFAYDDRVNQTPLSVFAQLLQQLYPKVAALGEPLRKLRAECELDPPSSSQLLKILQKLPATVLLAFDSLDEATPEVRDELLTWIGKIQVTSPTLLVSTRRDIQPRDTPPGLVGYVVVEANKGDMEAFIKAKIQADSSVQRIIKRTINHGAAEWMDNQVDQILNNAQRM